MNKGRLPLPGEDIEAEMFAMLIEHMEKHGRNRYEISNFAIPGYESSTILSIGKMKHMRVLGRVRMVFNGKRYSNIGPITKYMEKTMVGKRPIQQTHIVTTIEAMEEEMFLGLRKSDGVSFSSFQKKFGKSLDVVYGETLSGNL